MLPDDTKQPPDPREMGEALAVWREFVSARLARPGKDKSRPLPDKSDRFVVYLATKRAPNTGVILNHAMSQLSDGWGLQILATADTRPWVSGLLKGLPGAQIDLLPGAPAKGITHFVNEMKRREEFWNLVRGRYQLFLDDDTILCHSQVEEFLNYDYVGAPWGAQHVSPWCRYGSGGMSIRNKESMIRICRDCNTKSWMIGPEDVFFSITMRLEADNYRLPSDEVARRFAVESVYHPEPFGLHRTWAHLKAGQLRDLLSKVKVSS